MCTMCVLGALGDPKRASDSPEAVNHDVGVGNGTQVCCKSKSFLNFEMLSHSHGNDVDGTEGTCVFITRHVLTFNVIKGH